MGAQESVIRNTSKRNSRRENAHHFTSSISKFRSQHGHATGDENVRMSEETGIRVCVRKRPIFAHEQKEREFDVITVPPSGGNGCHISIHDARMEADLIKMFMNHHTFKFDAVFSERCTDTDVYRATAQPLVLKASMGMQSTIMMYGQTGSGKTYTMTALQQRAFPDLFSNICPDTVLTVSFVELAGDKCHDMLNAGASTSLSSGHDGSMHPYPCVEIPVRNAKELSSVVDHANSLRATAATGVHDQSSRSHAICRIFVHTPDGTEGQLTLVDLAGTEHRIDSDEHNAERRKEGALINASLASLKECIRAIAQNNKFIPYRNNRLTQLMRGCFADVKRHSTVIIATVSPSSKDTEHSLNTLRHACIMDGQGTGQAAGSSHLIGGATVRENLGSVDVAALGRAKFEERKKNRNLGVVEEKPKAKPAPAHQSKQSSVVARQQLDRHGLASLPPSVKAELVRARDADNLRDNPLQRKRLLGGGGAGAYPGERIVKSKRPAEKPKKKTRRPDFAVDVPEEDLNTSREWVGLELPEHEDESPHYTPQYERVVNDPEPEPRREPAPRPNAIAPRPQEPSPARNDVEIHERLEDQKEHAVHLWHEFRSRGKGCRVWRKNDLRLISTHILPGLPQDVVPSALTWMSPDAALDELTEVVRKLDGGDAADSSSPQQPQPAPVSQDFKHQAARLKREQLQREKHEHFASKVPQQQPQPHPRESGGYAGSREPTGDVVADTLRDELAALEERLQRGPGSAAAQHGLRRQIELKKARITRYQPAKPQPPIAPEEHPQQQQQHHRTPDATPTYQAEVEPLGGPPVQRKERQKGKRRMAPGVGPPTPAQPYADDYGGGYRQTQGSPTYAAQGGYPRMSGGGGGGGGGGAQQQQVPAGSGLILRGGHRSPNHHVIGDSSPLSPITSSHPSIAPKYHPRRSTPGPVGAAAAPWGNYYTEEDEN